jgi:hypothetical protein
LHQIVGYYILCLLSGKSAKRPLGEIKRVGIYFSRHAFLHTLEIEKMIEVAAPDTKERKTYLSGFEYPACREWSRDLESILGQSGRRRASAMHEGRQYNVK